ncbi:MAG: cation:proton antiporter [Luteibaculaceae bacterium]
MESHFSMPLQDEVLIFCVVLLVIFFAPVLLKKIKIPGIVGLILAGALLGPNGIHLLERSDAITLFGTVGLLYIMFLAGLEVDLKEFKKNSGKSLLFGTLTFAIPISLGTLGAMYLMMDFLNIPIFNAEKLMELFDIEAEGNTTLQWKSSLLLASMFASHTLLTYPLVSKLGANKNEAAIVTVGGTIITDTAALMVLAVIVGSTGSDLNQEFWITLGTSLLIFSLIVFLVFPYITRWFFKNVESEGTSQYIFVLAIVFLSAYLAEVAGVEHIIGAFLAGLALNKQIPHSSALMNRIEFVGNALFIPFFLISVGMLIDYRSLFAGPETLIIATFMIAVAVSGKWLAAFFTQKILGYSSVERKLMFGLSNAQAAATLAAVMIGFKIGLLSEAVLNGTILMILATSLISGFATEPAARIIGIKESERLPSDEDINEDKILVPVINEKNIDKLIDFSILVRPPTSKSPIYPLTVVNDDEDAKSNIMLAERKLEKSISYAAATETKLQLISRVDTNLASGITRAAKENFVTDIIIGWEDKPTVTTESMGNILPSFIGDIFSASEKIVGKVIDPERLFGGLLKQILDKNLCQVILPKFAYPINTIARVILVVPPNAHLETGFARWVGSIKNLCKQTNSGILCLTTEDMQTVLKESMAKKPAVDIKFKNFDDWDDFLIISREIQENDLFVVISARQQTLSYQRNFENLPKYLKKYFIDINFAIIYPEQKS